MNDEHSNSADSGRLRRRGIRSYVLRAGRLTTAQKRALTELWPRFGIERGAGIIDLDAEFGRAAPVVLEIGFGNGENLVSMAAAQPTPFPDTTGFSLPPATWTATGARTSCWPIRLAWPP